MEKVEELEGIKSDEFKKIRPFINPEAVDDPEIAIIGFWNLTKNHVFRCYHYFLVPNPMKREIKDTKGT